MEINLIKEDKDLIELNILGEGHTLCNIVRDELSNMDEVSFASYNIKHPLVSSPILAVKVKKGKPKKAIADAVQSLRNKIKELKSSFK